MVDTTPSSFRPDLLAGQVAFVTGGATGIGKEICRVLGRHGARIELSDARERRGADTPPGALFTLRLPALPVPAAGAPPEPASAPADPRAARAAAADADAAPGGSTGRSAAP